MSVRFAATGATHAGRRLLQSRDEGDGASESSRPPVPDVRRRRLRGRDDKSRGAARIKGTDDDAHRKARLGTRKRDERERWGKSVASIVEVPLLKKAEIVDGSSLYSLQSIQRGKHVSNPFFKLVQQPRRWMPLVKCLDSFGNVIVDDHDNIVSDCPSQ